MHGISFSEANGNFRLTTLADKVKSTAETVVSKTADKEEIILKGSASMPNSPHPGRKPPVYEAGIDCHGLLEQLKNCKSFLKMNVVALEKWS